MLSWETSRDPETGEVHRYEIDCLCKGCDLIRMSKETHRESKTGGYSSYRGANHNRKAGREARGGQIVKQNKSKPHSPQRRKEEKNILDDGS